MYTVRFSLCLYRNQIFTLFLSYHDIVSHVFASCSHVSFIHGSFCLRPIMTLPLSVEV